MNVVWPLVGLLATARPLFAEDLVVTPLLQQGTVVFLSDRVTAGGLGGGFGVELAWRRHYVLQADATWLWGAGNALATRAAAGYQRDGFWSPALWGTFNVLWGNRIERLADDGTRAAAPAWAMGLRISPVRFSGASGFVSAFQPGAALAPTGGVWLELTLLAAGARW